MSLIKLDSQLIALKRMAMLLRGQWPSVAIRKLVVVWLSTPHSGPPKSHYAIGGFPKPRGDGKKRFGILLFIAYLLLEKPNECLDVGGYKVLQG